MGGIQSLSFLYGNGFLSRGFIDWREIYTAVRPYLGQVFSHFGGTATGMAEFWASTGAIWRCMLLAKALVESTISILHTL